MNRVILFMAGLALPILLNAQGLDWEGGAVDQGNVSDVAAGGGRLFFALIAGILLAFAFQWILTCISAATGITLLGKTTRKFKNERHSFQGSRRREDPDRNPRYDRYERHEKSEKDETEWEKPAMKIQATAGIWVVVTCAISVFCAAWLSSEMIRFGGRTEAVILGLVVWAGFMFSMMWLEASMLGSLLGNLTGAFKAGLKSAAAPFKAAAGPLAEKASSSADEVAAKVREEFRAQGGAGGLKEKLQQYVGRMQDRTLDRSRIESDADHLFGEAEVRDAVIQSGRTPDLGKFQEIAAGRRDLSPEEQRTLSEVLHDRWNRIAGAGRREGAFASGPAYAGSETAESRSQALEAESEDAALAGETASLGGPGSRRSGVSPSMGSPTEAFLSGSSRTAGHPAAARTEARGDIATRVQAFKEFLHKADKHDLNPVRIEEEVEAMLYHPEEGYSRMERSIRDMRREEMAQALRQRRDITLDEADSIADLIDAARTRILSRSEVREHRAQEFADKGLARVHDFVYSVQRPELDMEGFKSDFAKMLDDPAAGLNSLKGKASGLDKDDLVKVIAARKGVSREEAEKMADQAEQAMRKAEEQAHRIEEETRRRLDSAMETAAEQAEATRKVAASAAWWLAGVAVGTGIAAALGGLLGAAT